mmetsp:Transcript_42053/g.134301  ORF Transcript_42053/g.134301 Transcript_42053/m.134301 type:complete len:149 (+) Transcript_42053:198-644(+)
MAREFGSKADMLSGKIDEVSRNSIWSEHCSKELSHMQLNTNFSIANPWKMATLPEKPNYTMPNNMVTKDMLDESVDALKAVCSITNPDKRPNEKYTLPMTSSQEYGWSTRMLVPTNPMFQQRRKACDITRYADDYYNMSGTTPFSRKE